MSPFEDPDLKGWRDLLRTVADASADGVDDLVPTLLQRIVAVTGGHHGFALLARCSADPTFVTLGGWQPSAVFHDVDPPAPVLAQIQLWMKDPAFVAADAVARTLASTHGQARAFLREDVLGHTSWESQPAWALMQARGMVDRMVGGVPLGRNVELFVGVDRGPSRAIFGPNDRTRLLQVLELIVPFGRHLTLIYGLAEGMTPLSARERTVLKGLLAGATEAELAEEHGLSRHTLHDYVKAIYRKFGVGSRAALTARWLQPWHA